MRQVQTDAEREKQYRKVKAKMEEKKKHPIRKKLRTYGIAFVLLATPIVIYKGYSHLSAGKEGDNVEARKEEPSMPDVMEKQIENPEQYYFIADGEPLTDSNAVVDNGGELEFPTESQKQEQQQATTSNGVSVAHDETNVGAFSQEEIDNFANGYLADTFEYLNDTTNTGRDPANNAELRPIVFDEIKQLLDFTYYDGSVTYKSDEGDFPAVTFYMSQLSEEAQCRTKMTTYRLDSMVTNNCRPIIEQYLEEKEKNETTARYESGKKEYLENGAYITEKANIPEMTNGEKIINWLGNEFSTATGRAKDVSVEFIQKIKEVKENMVSKSK